MMTRAIGIAALALLLSGCDGSKNGSPGATEPASTEGETSPAEPAPEGAPGEAPAPQAEEPAGVGSPAPAGDESAAPAEDADECVADCVERNQMRSVAAEVIEADCRRECESD